MCSIMKWNINVLNLGLLLPEKEIILVETEEGDKGDNDVVWILILLVEISHRIHLQIH